MDALKWIGIGGASGIALRGIQGMIEQPRRNLKQPVTPISAPATFDIPVQDEQKAANVLDDALSSVGKYIGDTAKWTGEAMKGQHVTDYKNNPLWLPATVGGGAGALLGGYKLHDMVLERLRKNQLKAELNTARKDYEEALQPKVAGEDSLATDLDVLFDTMVKVSGSEEKAATAGDQVGKWTGRYALWALLTGALGAGASYQHFKKKQRRSLLEEAQKKRRRQKFQTSPTPLVARSVPVESPEPIETPEPFKGAPSLATTEDQLG